ncbi:hypothetical protein [Nesterenkonia pannonica]|uniref:hypothetical protein n=1 Tax=Nesterenkonia pannonica TaxID=1548602 RepID=UPI0021643436|nr:hypothetical protein [Nesterenkonia pannonica]
MRAPDTLGTRPAVAIFRRPRVTRILGDAVSRSPITLMVAPHSFGKLTAATQWAARQKSHVLWVNAAASGGHGWDFYRSLVTALTSVSGGERLTELTGGLDGQRPLRRMGTILGRELHRCGMEAAVIVEHAERLSAEALALLRTLADRHPGVRYVVLAAELTPTSSPTLRRRAPSSSAPTSSSSTPRRPLRQWRRLTFARHPPTRWTWSPRL